VFVAQSLSLRQVSAIARIVTPADSGLGGFDGVRLGLTLGLVDGVRLGLKLGLFDGLILALGPVGFALVDGVRLGVKLRVFDGLFDGLALGVKLGLLDGPSLASPTAVDALGPFDGLALVLG
jgi:hypothetical protein